MLGKTNPNLVLGAIALTAVVAVFTDLRMKRIPNLLTFSSITLGLFYHLIFEAWAELGFALLGCGVGLLLFLPLFILRWLGAGDVKLLMAFGAWGGSQFALQVALWSIAVGGLLGLIQLLVKRQFVDFLRRFWAFIQSWGYRELEPMAFRGDQTLRLPFAVPMAIAAIGRSFEVLPEALRWLTGG